MKLRELLAYFVIVLFVYLLVRLSSLDFDMNTIISQINSLNDGIDKADYKKALDFYDKLFNSEHMIYLRSASDMRVLQTIFKSIHQETNGFYVEFAATSSQLSMTHYLQEKYNWKGIFINETITPDTILKLLRKYNIPNEFDLLTENIDQDNYLIIEQMLTEYNPKVIFHRVKQESGGLCDTTVRSSTFNEGSNHLNTRSVCAFYCLAKRYDYSMVYCESAGRHCFLIRNDLLRKHVQVDPNVIQVALNPIFLYEKLRFSFLKRNWHKEDC